MHGGVGAFVDGKSFIHTPTGRAVVNDEMTALADELGKAGATALHKVPGFTHCETAQAARAALDALHLADGDAVLVKGSNSVGLGAIVAALAGEQG